MNATPRPMKALFLHRYSLSKCVINQHIYIYICQCTVQVSDTGCTTSQAAYCEIDFSIFVCMQQSLTFFAKEQAFSMCNTDVFILFHQIALDMESDSRTSLQYSSDAVSFCFLIGTLLLHLSVF